MHRLTNRTVTYYNVKQSMTDDKQNATLLIHTVKRQESNAYSAFLVTL